jgi:4a-hydroxytetrahydrobiopterin dehydratase
MALLTDKKCKPCEGGIPALKSKEIYKYLSQLKDGWKVIEDSKIVKQYSFVNFRHTMDFVDKVASLAESEGHHPVMHVYFGKVEIELWTHAIKGLSENDFILAVKIDSILL